MSRRKPEWFWVVFICLFGYLYLQSKQMKWNQEKIDELVTEVGEKELIKLQQEKYGLIPDGLLGPKTCAASFANDYTESLETRHLRSLCAQWKRDKEQQLAKRKAEDWQLFQAEAAFSDAGKSTCLKNRARYFAQNYGSPNVYSLNSFKIHEDGDEIHKYVIYGSKTGGGSYNYSLTIIETKCRVEVKGSYRSYTTRLLRMNNREIDSMSGLLLDEKLAIQQKYKDLTEPL